MPFVNFCVIFYRMDKAGLYYKKMTETPVSKLIVTLGIPTTISMLITSIYNLADTYFVGRLGESAQGAISILFALQCIVQAVAFMFGHGSGVFVSKHLADKDVKGASKFVSSAFYLAVFIGIIFAIVGTIVIKPLMLFLGSTNTILPYAVTYGSCVILATPFIMGSLVMNNCLRYEGKAFYAMIGLGTGGLLNIFGDFLLVYVFEWGVFGAGFATAVSQVISFVILYVMYKKSAQSKISITYISKNYRDYFGFMKVGFPSFIRQGLTSISGGLLNNLSKPYGDATISAMGVVNKYISLIAFVGLGIGQGFQPVSAFNYQAKKYKRVIKSIFFTICFGAVLVTVLSLPGIFFSEFIISLFQKSEAVIDIGSLALKVASIGIIFMPVSIVTNMLFQSTFQSGKASFLSMLRSGLTFIPLVIILEANFNVLGIQIAQPIADAISSIICLPFLITFVLKISKEKEEMKELVVASGNKGKLDEIKFILGDKYKVVSMAEAGFVGDVEETGVTFYENALLKAKTVSLALSKDVLADDSGLMVDALDGAPGVYSARYAGEHGNDALNRKVLLENLKDKNDRKARFASSVVLYTVDGDVISGYGETEGEILREEVGSNGFGYDSLFLSYDLNKSFGVATKEEKNKVSHRYRALCDLKGKLNG